MKKIEKLTLDVFDSIPVGGEQTFRLPDRNAVYNARSYAYQLGDRYEYLVTTKADTESCTITIRKDRL